MFKINAAPTFTAPVPISVPGLPEPLEVVFTFRHKNKDALKAWITEGAGKDDAALLHELVVDWAGMHDERGEAVPYSLSALHTLIGSYWAARDEITSAYLRELKESKAKNSVRLQAA